MWKRILFVLIMLPYAVANGSGTSACEAPCVRGTEDLMSQKEHGTSRTPVQQNLRWGCDRKLSDRICNFNRKFAEVAGYWETTSFRAEVDKAENKSVVLYDSNTGKPLFQAPVGRSWQDFLEESEHHGWPSFRDEEVIWKNVRVLPDGETVSVDGTHLGHNIPDRKGRRFCIILFPSLEIRLTDRSDIVGISRI